MISALAFMVVVACSSPEPLDAPDPREQNLNFRLLPTIMGDLVLGQCSRSTPKADGKFWVPEFAQIMAFEASLTRLLSSPPTLLADAESHDRANFGSTEFPSDFAKNRASYFAEYIGYTSEGSRLIYGNFVPHHDFMNFRQGLEIRGEDFPFVACDGGYKYFGAEYDPAQNVIVRMSFNGAPDWIGVPDLTF